jgi:hypothetical protein
MWFLLKGIRETMAERRDEDERGVLGGVVAILRPQRRPVLRVLAICGYLLMSEVAGLFAWVEGLKGGRNPVWEPTRGRLE